MSEEIDRDWLPSLVAVNDMAVAVSRVRALTLRLQLMQSASAREDTRQRIASAKRDLQAAEKTYTSLLTSDSERAAYQAFLASKALYLQAQLSVENLTLNGKKDEAAQITEGPLSEHADRMTAQLMGLITLNKRGAAAASERSDQVFDQATRIVFALLLASLALTVGLAIVLTRSIVRPLTQAVEVARTVASGDLTQAIDVQGRDEPASLLRSLKDMQHHLRETIRHIAQSSRQLASASEELHSVTADATRGLEQQYNEVELAATAVTEMTSAVEEVARNAVSTSEASKQTDSIAQDGQGQVRQTVESITHLTLDVASTAAEVEHLATNVREIGQVLGVIRAVAEQTNLLALNAAIEAARAGEQGRGFAVVADEVRALAHRTQQSTEQIEQMISKIENGTEQTVSAMQGSKTRAQSTLVLAQAAGEALNEIAQAIAQINERNLVIASATEEQAQVARDVDRNLVNIRDLSHKTSAGANQTSAASQELSRLAVDLDGLVARFRT
ncbi:methyl-accepting chemotaxis protein [Pseudomonas sp. H9]|uniref:methyl-accepting chemotaxis protein n=1 Tax=Pseudomonas sp. H9 TaxID=483968 RepID=UPI003531CB8F